MPSVSDRLKSSKYLTTKYILHIHVAQLMLIASAMIVTLIAIIVRDKSRPMRRANIIALGMGGKSLVFLAYQLLTEYTRQFRKWASLKANFILNALEVLFWAAVMGLTFQANLQYCKGTACAMSWVVMVLAGFLHVSYMYTAAVSWKEWRESKRVGNNSSGGRGRAKTANESFSHDRV